MDLPTDRSSVAPAGACEDDYRIAIAARPGYLFVTVSGANSVETMRRYTADVREACIRHRQTRVLFVVNLTGPDLAMLDVYKAVEKGSEEAAGIGMRVAYVDLKRSPSRANMQIAEDVANTRGVVVRTFTDIAAAEAWLTGSESH